MDREAVPPLKVDRVVLLGPATWVAFTPDQWTSICNLATRYGWSIPDLGGIAPSGIERAFEVRDELALELARALEGIRRDYTDRELSRQFFGRRGWKQKLGLLASFFACGGAAIFVCHASGSLGTARE
jgi:hypothetical protein